MLKNLILNHNQFSGEIPANNRKLKILLKIIYKNIIQISILLPYKELC